MQKWLLAFAKSRFWYVNLIWGIAWNNVRESNVQQMGQEAMNFCSDVFWVIDLI